MSEGEAAGLAGALAVVVAFAIDGVWGEPADRWHPVAWMGRGLGAVGAPWPARSPAGAFVRGALTWVAGAVICVGVALALARTVDALGALAGARTTVSQTLDAGRAPVARASIDWPLMRRVGLQALLLGVLLKPLLAWRMLREEVAAVGAALTQGDDPVKRLEAGRQRLSRLVSRDTATLAAGVVCESAIESLAENLNDSLVAPLFWFAVGGLPAAALYRFANTADAMWGYHGRYEYAGKWAARADDVLSYVPARLTAGLLAAMLPASPRGLAREAARTPSPNSGWPMAMMAMGLRVRLSKPGVYVLNGGARPAGAQDIGRAIAAGSRAATAAVLGAALALAMRWALA